MRWAVFLLLLPLASSAHWLVGDCGSYASIVDVPLSDGDVVEYCPGAVENGTLSTNLSLTITGGPVEVHNTWVISNTSLRLENLSITTYLPQYTYAVVAQGEVYGDNITWRFENTTYVGGYPLYYGYASLIYMSNESPGRVELRNVDAAPANNSSLHFRSFSLVKGQSGACFNITLSNISHKRGRVVHYFGPSCPLHVEISNVDVVGGGVWHGIFAHGGSGHIENFTCRDEPPSYVTSFFYRCISLSGNFSGRVHNGTIVANATTIDGYTAGLQVGVGLWKPSYLTLSSIKTKGRFGIVDVYLDPMHRNSGGHVRDVRVKNLDLTEGSPGRFLLYVRRATGSYEVNISDVNATLFYIYSTFNPAPNARGVMERINAERFIIYSTLASNESWIGRDLSGNLFYLRGAIADPPSQPTTFEGTFTNMTFNDVSLDVAWGTERTRVFLNVTDLTMTSTPSHPRLYTGILTGLISLTNVTVPLRNNVLLVISSALFEGNGSDWLTWGFHQGTYEAEPYLFVLKRPFQGNGYIVWKDLCNDRYRYRVWASPDVDVSSPLDVRERGRPIGMAECRGRDIWAYVPSFS